MILEQHVLSSGCGEYTRDVWVLPGPKNQEHRLCIVLDAELYLDNVDCLPIIEGLMKRGEIPPMTCLFVSHLSVEARHYDYVCNPRYGRFIAEDAVNWARERSGDVTNSDNLICGLSLSGLAAAYTAFLHPSVFSFSLCQSGSFWWMVDRDLSLPRTNVKFWLSVGDEETETGVSHPPTDLFQRVSQIDGVENAVRAFEALGATVKYNLYSGGHNKSPWREELAPALTWLVGKTP